VVGGEPWIKIAAFLPRQKWQAPVTFVHVRHKPPTELTQPRGLVLALPSLRSGINLSRIARLAGCFGVERIIVEGAIRLDKKIARDGAEAVRIESRRSLPPVLKKMKDEGYQVVGLEQTENSECLFEFGFKPKTVLLIGHERHGISETLLEVVDRVAEIPVYGMPFSHNVATATSLAVYEYCRQFPKG
jgi:tRNA G18 (ribose-2'-O)-methylase SpoU